MFKGVEIIREIDRQRMKEGEHLVVTLRIRRKFPFPLGWNMVIESLPEKLSGFFEPHKQMYIPGFKKEQIFHYMIPEVPRGQYQLLQCTLVGGDFFGFLQMEKKFDVYNEFLVYPSFNYLTHWSTGDGRISGNIHVPHMRSNDVASVRGVRDYQRGDRLSQVHWRASAKGNGLKTKEFEHQAMNQLVFFLDVKKSSTPGLQQRVFETSVKLAASLIYYSHLNHHPYGFVAKERERISIPPALSQEHFFRVFDQLARISQEGQDSIARLLGREAMEYPRGFTLVVITTSLTKELVMQANALTRSGRNVQLFWLHDRKVPMSVEQDLLKLLTSGNVKYHAIHVDTYDELKKVGGA